MRKIAICGFADSKRDAPWTDPTWEKWVVNDLYAHLPAGCQVQRVFEIHHLLNMGPRRNPSHEKWMSEEAPKLGIPIVMQEENPQYPSSMRLPVQDLIACFGDEAFGGRAGCDYFTNSIAWMIAMALYELSDWVPVGKSTENEPNRKIRLCPPGTEIGLWGIDMAAESEFGSQRPSCEFWLGVAKSMGCSIYIPDDSELLKKPALYGFDTSHPLRVRLQSQLQSCREQTIQIQQQIQQRQMEMQQLEAQLHTIRGRKMTLSDLIRNWTMPTDISVGQETELAEHRQQPIFTLADGSQVSNIQLSDGAGQPVLTGGSTHG